LQEPNLKISRKERKVKNAQRVQNQKKENKAAIRQLTNNGFDS